MRVLISGERSGLVRLAFLAAGHDAWSCHPLPATGRTLRHLEMAIEDGIERTGPWDLLIVMAPPGDPDVPRYYLNTAIPKVAVFCSTPPKSGAKPTQYIHQTSVWLKNLEPLRPRRACTTALTTTFWRSVARQWGITSA